MYKIVKTSMNVRIACISTLRVIPQLARTNTTDQFRTDTKSTHGPWP